MNATARAYFRVFPYRGRQDEKRTIIRRTDEGLQAWHLGWQTSTPSFSPFLLPGQKCWRPEHDDESPGVHTPFDLE